MIPILAALLTVVICLVTARLLRCGTWAAMAAAVAAALAAIALPDLHEPGMSGAQVLAADISRAATAALVGTLLGTVPIVGGWVRTRQRG